MRLKLLLFTLILAGSLHVTSAHAQIPRLTPGKADLVLVHKGKRILELKRGGRTIRRFRVALGRNPVGPKRKLGDGRTPEGVYTLDWRNPNSEFYRSIHVSYPQPWDYDRAARWGVPPGDLIMIHGLPNGVASTAASQHPTVDWTNGCIAVTNEEMDQIWHLVDDGTPIIIYP